MSTRGLGEWLQRYWRKAILAALAAILPHSFYLFYREELRFALVSELLSDGARTIDIDTSSVDRRFPVWVQRLPIQIPRYSQRFEVTKIVFAADDPPELVDRARRVFREADIEQAAAPVSGKQGTGHTRRAGE